MSKTLTSSPGGMSDAGVRNAIVEAQNQCFDSAGLAIGSSNKAKIKIVNTVYTIIDGDLTIKSGEEIALVATQTVTNAKFNVFVMTLRSSDGAAVILMGTEAATLAGVLFPVIPAGSIVLGFVVVHPTGTGNFVGGTTEFDDGTVVPNAVYKNTVGGFNPNIWVSV